MVNGIKPAVQPIQQIQFKKPVVQAYKTKVEKPPPPKGVKLDTKA